MPPPREWLRPPRLLLTILFLVTLVSVSALGWLGWRLLDQERVVEAQRARERLEQAADRIAAITRGALAEAGERVGSWVIAPPSDGNPREGVLLMAAGNGLTAFPAHRLLYEPAAGIAAPDPDSPAFADGEALEFQQAQPARALDWYRHFADSSKDPEQRAGALLREARVLRRLGRNEEARAVWTQLASSGARVAGVPAELAARHALAELSGRPADARSLREDLLQARWTLTRGQFAFYRSEAARLSGDAAVPPAEAAALSEAAASAWDALERDPSPRGQSTTWMDGNPFLLIWRGAPGRRAILIAKPESIVRQAFAGREFAVAALDSEGRLVAGSRNGAGRAAIRTPAETQLPWTLSLTGGEGASEAGMLARQRFLLLVTGVTVFFVMAGAYFIARAVRGDLAVARLQSDFVSAVSHEFRSPLTSIRQLSEILALGRIPNEGRRQVYYETLVRETTRLQRLVEALLNFGRMEAGVRQYRFEPLDAASLVTRVAVEFEQQIAGSGRHIELEAAVEECRIDADPEALSVALRNLVDNALKYSPNCPTVWVRWGIEKERVAIRVRDLGPGIPASERRDIFRKFVRGSAAEAANVRGSGVGLAMVRHIVAAHGGDITVASEPGAGSIFTIFLPPGAART